MPMNIRMRMVRRTAILMPTRMPTATATIMTTAIIILARSITAIVRMRAAMIMRTSMLAR